MTKDERGFASMDPGKQREIASMGGRAAHESGHAHEFDHQEAVAAGRKGGRAVSRDREHMADIGRKGGQASHGGNGHVSERSSRGGGSHERSSSRERSSSHERTSKSGYGEKAREFLSREIKHHVDDQGMPQDQAVAAAMSEARRKGYEVPNRK
jgi:general stress protein YciG